MLFVKTEEELLLVNVSKTTLETPMLPAGLNVPQMQNAHPAKHVKTCIVLTPVQQPIVEWMHSARWSIISPTVSVSRDTLETPSHLVANLHLSLNQLKLKILAIPILVDQTAILPDKLETGVTALVSQRWLDHHLTVDLNVLSTRTVPLKLHVSTENVKTPVLDCVEEMLIAE